MAPKYTIAQLAESEVQFQGASGRVYTCRPLRMSGMLRVVRHVGRRQWDDNPMDPENMLVFLWFAARRQPDGTYLESSDDLSPAQRGERKKKGDALFPGLEEFGAEFGAGDFHSAGVGCELFLDVAEMSGVYDPEACRDLRIVGRKSKETASKTLRIQVEALESAARSLEMPPSAQPAPEAPEDSVPAGSPEEAAPD